MIFKFIFNVVNLNRVMFVVVWLNLEKWSEDVFVSIMWDLSYFGDDNFIVVVFLVCFFMRDDNVYFYSIFFL